MPTYFPRPPRSPAWARTTASVALMTLITLCGCGRVGDRTLPFTPDPLAEAKSIVQAYAGGQAVGSEVESFDAVIERVAAADTAKATKLRGFLDEVRKKGKADVSKAKKLLGEL